MAQNNYESIEALVKALLNGRLPGGENVSITAKNFSGASLMNYGDRIQNIWEGLLDILKNENIKIGHYGLRESDFDNDEEVESIGDYINHNADLSDDYLNNYIEKIKTDGAHWNESLKLLVDFYEKYFHPDSGNEGAIEFVNGNNDKVKDSHGIIKPGSDSGSQINFRLDDLVHGDAGNYFGDNQSINGNNYQAANKESSSLIDTSDPNKQQRKFWVRPWFNIDGDTYSAVRGNDKIKKVLNSKKDLQFTRYKEKGSDYWKQLPSYKDYFGNEQPNPEGLEKYLRLIMPMYERVVEIEDLDRNFWVIGQSLSALCAYLFGDDSPIATLLTGLLDEVTQLWENVFYLWATMIEGFSQEKINAKFLFVPVVDGEDLANSASSYVYDGYDENKFDNFSKSQNLNNRSNIEWLRLSKVKLDYLTEQYPNNTLVIMPEIRRKNYSNNFYAKIIYPGFLIYERQKINENYENRWKYIPFDSKEEIEFDLTNTSIYQNLTTFDEDWENNIVTIDSWHNLIDDDKKVAIAAIRTIPDLRIFNYNHTTGAFNSIKLKLNFEDVGAAASKKIDGSNIETVYATYDIEYNNSSEALTIAKEFKSTAIRESKIYNLYTFPYYRGEVCSWVKFKVEVDTEMPDPFKTNDAFVLKLGSFLPQGDMIHDISVTKANILTAIRGNVTNKISNWSSSSNITYHKNDWTTYSPFNGDILIDETGVIPPVENYNPFGTIVEENKSYITEAHLEADSITAVENFILARGRKDDNFFAKPSMYLTLIGLTPWAGTTRDNAYWDGAGISHFLLYIPKMDEYYDGDIEYKGSKRYEDLTCIKKITYNGKEKGKICICTLINYIETFPNPISAYQMGSIDTIGWRLLQFIGEPNETPSLTTERYKRRGIALSSKIVLDYGNSSDLVYNGIYRYFNGHTNGNFQGTPQHAHVYSFTNTNAGGMIDKGVVSGIGAPVYDNPPLEWGGWINNLANITYTSEWQGNGAAMGYTEGGHVYV